MTQSYSLLTQPWIRVRRPDGDLAELGLSDVFAQAGSIRRLAGELATQDAAVLRLLIAILYRALPVEGSTNTMVRAWSRWWKEDQLPVGEIGAYLDRYRERFDLLGATPFMQVADLAANKTSGLGKLIADLPDGEPFFTTRAAHEAESLSLSEAARWLVHAHAFDPSGIKTGAHGDPSAKGGKGYPIGTGWTGQCGLLLVEGTSLRETVLLNLALPLAASASDSPTWERVPQSAARDLAHPLPTGPADLLTWPSRRVRLTIEADTVTDVLICNGDKIEVPNWHLMEPHCAWRYSEPQSKKLGTTAFMPRTHDPERALWRGLPALLGQQVAESGKDAAKPPPAAVLDWIATLIEYEALPPGQPVAVRAAGVKYGPKASTIAATVDDELRLCADVLRSPRLKRMASDAVVDAEGAVWAASSLASNLAAASGEGDLTGSRDRARERGYAALDAGYRRWVGSLRPDSAEEERITAWQFYVQGVIRELGDSLIRDAGAPAWRGRPARVGMRDIEHLDSSLAAVWFTSALRKALPFTVDQARTAPQEAQ